MANNNIFTKQLNLVLDAAVAYASKHRHEFVTPEHLLMEMTKLPGFRRSVRVGSLTDSLESYIERYVPKVPETIEYEVPDTSADFRKVFDAVAANLISSSTRTVGIPHAVMAIVHLDRSYAAECLRDASGDDVGGLVARLIREFRDDKPLQDEPSDEAIPTDEEFDTSGAYASLESDCPEMDPLDDDGIEGIDELPAADDISGIDAAIDEDIYMTEDGILGDDILDDIIITEITDGEDPKSREWLQYVDVITGMHRGTHHSIHGRLIGRESEMRRLIQILCRRDKNNPLLIGEPGVGKTAMVYGLAELIDTGKVPRRLRNFVIYSLDMGALIAGAQYRGDFENRLKMVLKGLEHCDSDVILYIDEMSTIFGAGSAEGSGMDASNLLRPYLEEGTIRIMGTATCNDYNRKIVNRKGYARRFETIMLDEPTPDECKKILTALLPRYQDYHRVTYLPEALDMAVNGAAKYIKDRYLPDKAIDVIDEAGAAAAITGEGATIGQREIVDVISRICRVDNLAELEDTNRTERLAHLQEKIRAQVFGQDGAVEEVCHTVLMGVAGLLDDDKPMASLLFVGPTGVGKTEVARVLASELALPLLRYDMSEYAEKHSIAKLIGAPAGYVGYDDGGNLTDAVRKTPHCILLFDEIEKAHPDIYDLLLQVLDYAVLTDNKGNKADFRHAIIIFTTNAGAADARRAGVGFTRGSSSGAAMMKGVKRTFKPEFLNRLTAITVFNDMTREMADLILDKKLRVLRAKLEARHVTLDLSEQAREMLLDEGFSPEYGGREIERVIASKLKPLLMREMLFGSLRNGGTACVTVAGDTLEVVAPAR